MRSLAADMVEARRLGAADADGFVAAVHDAARSGRFAMTLSMFAVVAVAG
jgi:hypothetical protein